MTTLRCWFLTVAAIASNLARMAESWPESEYLATLPEYQYLTKELADYWQTWVPDFPPSALDTIAEGGYYSMEIADGLRLLSINSDYWYTLNFYSFLNDINPNFQKMKDWIFKELTMAKAASEKVLLIAHIPPGDTTSIPEYGDFFLNMTRTFGDIIVGHLFGHTHQDQFQLAQDSEGVHGVAMIAPSVTPYGHINPSFRLYSMDRETFQLLGYQQYHLNLTLANMLATKGVRPKFELAYSSKDYGLQDLSPQSWAGLVERLKQNATLLNSYHFNVHAQSEPGARTCDALCKIETLCAVTNVNSAEYMKCLHL